MARRRQGAQFASDTRFQATQNTTDFLNAVIDSPFYALEEALLSLEEFLPSVIAVVSDNLAKGGATAAKKQLLNAETPWGRARIAGEAYGVKFKPYGKGPGRYDTGAMYESITARLRGLRSGVARSVFGYSDNAPSYVYAQERGFSSAGVFDAEATRAAGVARFKAGRPKRRQGAFAIPAGMKRVQQLYGSAMSAAWNEAVRQWESAGYSGNAGTFKQAQARAGRRPGSPTRRTEREFSNQIKEVDRRVREAIGPKSGDSAIFGRLAGEGQMWWNS